MSTTALPPQTRRAALVAEVKVFVERHLGDPALSPPMIAARHNISVRHLHQLFRGEAQTVHALIRGLRLERCRAELLDRRRPVAAVGARWGYSDPAVFNRAFKQAYGLPPGEYRRRHTDLTASTG